MAIDTIKFVGRLHSLLNDIMDQLNWCYSFQVFSFFAFLFHSNLNRSGIAHFIEFIRIDNDKHGIHVWIYHHHNVYILPSYHASKCTNRRSIVHSIDVGIVLRGWHSHCDLHHPTVDQRSKVFPFPFPWHPNFLHFQLVFNINTMNRARKRFI